MIRLVRRTRVVSPRPGACLGDSLHGGFRLPHGVGCGIQRNESGRRLRGSRGEENLSSHWVRCSGTRESGVAVLRQGLRPDSWTTQLRQELDMGSTGCPQMRNCDDFVFLLPHARFAFESLNPEARRIDFSVRRRDDWPINSAVGLSSTAFRGRIPKSLKDSPWFRIPAEGSTFMGRSESPKGTT